MMPENGILFLCDGRAECEQRFGCFVDDACSGCCHRKIFVTQGIFTRRVQW